MSSHQNQCGGCRLQTSLTAGTLMEHTKLPLTTWFLAIRLISQAKTGISALALKRDLGVSYPTAWLLHHKINGAMSRHRAGQPQDHDVGRLQGAEVPQVRPDLPWRIRLQVQPSVRSARDDRHAHR
jgi:hypothetical protein